MKKIYLLYLLLIIPFYSFSQIACPGPTIYFTGQTYNTCFSAWECKIEITNCTFNRITSCSNYLIIGEQSVILKPNTLLLKGTTVLITNTYPYDFSPSIRSEAKEYSATGIEKSNMPNNQYFLYPNPTEGILNFEGGSGQAPCSIEIFNTVGKLVYRNENILTGETIDLSGHPAGMYLARMNIDVEIVNQKIMLK